MGKEGGGRWYGGFLRAQSEAITYYNCRWVGRWRSCQASIIATNGSTLLPITSGRAPTSGNLGLYSLSRSCAFLRSLPNDTEFMTRRNPAPRQSMSIAR